MSDSDKKKYEDFSIEQAKEELKVLYSEFDKLINSDKNDLDLEKLPKLGYFDEDFFNNNLRENQTFSSNLNQFNNQENFFVSKYKNNKKIKVIGIGNAGSNIVEYIAVNFNHLINDEVVFYLLNTDAKHLATLKNKYNSKSIKLLIDTPYTNGYGTGGNIQKAHNAISQYFDSNLDQILEDCDICIVVAGLGKGVGTAGAKYIVQKTAEKNILTLSYALMPSANEGNLTYEKASDALYLLLKKATATNLIRNDDLNQKLSNLPVLDRFEAISYEIGTSINAIIKLIQQKTIHDIDYADLTEFFDVNDESSYEFLVKEIKISSSQVDLRNIDLLNQDWLSADKLIVMYQLNRQFPGRLYDEINSKIRQSVSSNAHIVFGNSDADGDETTITIIGKKISGLIHSNRSLDYNWNYLINHPENQNYPVNFISPDLYINADDNKTTENALIVVNKDRLNKKTKTNIETSSILADLDSDN
ncbi:cell division protein FtsZ [Mycoplasma sp. E35C]|uniref:cell division protein FtsZ n=1 Tax=Mycoplasma sp. E35C TaxID=2801918 RepID=UPI001CA3ED8D|nr:cell division protein FtsZ [Mycoplasma sp. E35C]QZX48842.1 cell division protein FtsZ [Mycoplasma sp. E35C]